MLQREQQFGLLENVLDKSIIQVQKNDSERYRLYEYDKKTNTFNLIAMENETVKWVEGVHKDSQTLLRGMEIRNILIALYEKVFTNTYEVHWNKFFFEMLKYAYAEQGELDWAFKTTYLKVVKEETDLIPFKGFKVDNFDKAIDYWRELQPKILTVTKGWSEAYALFLDGEADMVLSYTTSPAYHLIAEENDHYDATVFAEGCRGNLGKQLIKSNYF